MFIEILWRGYTHWSMGIVGGVGLLSIYIVESKVKATFPIRVFISAFFIVALEFISGILLNVVFKLSIWDYSSLKYNLLGQISLFYSVLWFFLCIPAHILCRILEHRVFGALPWLKSNFK